MDKFLLILLQSFASRLFDPLPSRLTISLWTFTIVFRKSRLTSSLKVWNNSNKRPYPFSMSVIMDTYLSVCVTAMCSNSREKIAWSHGTVISISNVLMFVNCWYLNLLGFMKSYSMRSKAWYSFSAISRFRFCFLVPYGIAAKKFKTRKRGNHPYPLILYKWFRTLGTSFNANNRNRSSYSVKRISQHWSIKFFSSSFIPIASFCYCYWVVSLPYPPLLLAPLTVPTRKLLLSVFTFCEICFNGDMLLFWCC